MTLTQDVSNYWQECLGVNSSWREFTRELAILNTFGCLSIGELDFVTDLLLDHELFEDEDFEELRWSCWEFVTELDDIPMDEIDVTDCYKLVENGLPEEGVIKMLTEYGVAESVMKEFAEV